MRSKANQSQSINQSQLDQSAQMDQHYDQIESATMFEHNNGRPQEESGIDNLISDLLNENHQLSAEHTPKKGTNMSNNSSAKKNQRSGKSNVEVSDSKKSSSQYLAQNANMNKLDSKRQQSVNEKYPKSQVDKEELKENVHTPSHVKQSIEQDADSVNIEISAQRKTPFELLENLKRVLKEIEISNSKSFDYLVGMDLESDLKRASSHPSGRQIPDPLYSKIVQYIKEQEQKVSTPTAELQQKADSPVQQQISKSSNKKSLQKEKEEEKQEKPKKVKVSDKQLQSPQQATQRTPNPPSQKKAYQPPLYLAQLPEEQKQRYEQLVESFESSLSQITAKDVMKIKELSGKGIEQQLGLSYLYFLVAFDNTILLSNDKKTINNQSWEEIKKTFSNGGKLITALKRLRDYIENDMISNPHLAQIISLSQTLNSSPNSQPESSLQLFSTFLLNAIALTKFVKSLKGVTEEQLKPVNRRIASFKSPERARPQTSKLTPGNATVHRRLMSPSNDDSSTKSDFKNEISSQLYKKETEHLIESSEKKQQLKIQKLNLMNIKLSISKMKFEMEREEKITLREREKKEEQDYIEFKKKQLKAEANLLQEKRNKEKQDFIERTRQQVEEQKKAKEYQKSKEDSLLKEFNYDFEQERKFKNDALKKQREEEKDRIEFHQKTIREKERSDIEKFQQEKIREQKEREEERKKILKIEMEELKKRELQLQEEAEFLKKMRGNPIKMGK